MQSTDYENYDNNYENLTFEDSSEGTDNKTEIEDNDELLPGFGSAHMFMPIPNSGTVVAAHCGWQFRYNFVPNRVPRRVKYFYRFKKINLNTLYFRNHNRNHVSKHWRILW